MSAGMLLMLSGDLLTKASMMLFSTGSGSAASSEVKFTEGKLLKCLALYQVYAFHHQGGWILKVVEFLHLPLLEVV